jgi:hypothetical protein
VGAGLNFQIGLDDKTWDMLEQYFREVPERIDAAMRLMPGRASAQLTKEIVRLSPQDESWDEYRETVQSAEVKFDRAYAVVAGDENARVAASEKNMVFFAIEWGSGRLSPRHRELRAARGTQQISPVGQWLVDWSPWPPMMIPVQPDRKKDGVVLIGRGVRPDEYESVMKGHYTLWKKIRVSARKIGLQIPRNPNDLRPLDSIEFVRDIAYDVLRSEYGFGVGKPHWKPAFEKVKKLYPVWARVAHRIIGDPDYDGWKRDIKTDTIIGKDDLTLDFQQQLGLKMK